MVVATAADTPVGFLQLLAREKQLIIDLIAVDQEAQGAGLATGMIQFAARQLSNFESMLVGTQIANIPSLRVYEKLGFRMCGASYMYHYHGPLLAA